MSSVKIKTPNISQNIQTSLLTDYSSGTNLNVASSQSFLSGMYIVIGEIGLDNTEITHLTASPPDNNDLTVSALKFSHPAGTPIYYVDFDKYELSYRTSSAGAWVVYPSMPDNLIFDALYKEYRDSAALASYEWRYRYFSTEKSAYSDYSDTIGTTGWSPSQVGFMIREVRILVNDIEEKTVKDLEIIRLFNAAQRVIYSLYDRWWFLLKYGVPILTQTGIKQYGLASDVGRVKNVSFEYISGATDVTYNLKYVSPDEFDYETRDNNAANDDNTKIYSIYPPDSNNSIGYIRIWPKPLTAGLKITPLYYQMFNTLSSYSDTTLVPIPEMLQNYAIGTILGIRKEEDKFDFYLGKPENPGLFYQQIGILKLMQRKSVRSGRSLWEYKGVDYQKRFFGTRDVYSDSAREQNW